LNRGFAEISTEWAQRTYCELLIALSKGWLPSMEQVEIVLSNYLINVDPTIG
jgi:hypothetical protein